MASITSLRYRFRQSLRAPAREAYAWCTDFGPADGTLFSQRTERSVRRIAEDALVLTDTTYPGGRRRRIRRLVRLDPGAMAWTNTHLDGPFRHAQYWHRNGPDGPSRGHLAFEGLRLETTPRPLSQPEAARRAKENQRHDADEWRRRFAPALERDRRRAGRR